MATANIGTPENKVEAIYAKEVHADIVTGGGTKSLGDIVWRSIYNPQVVGEILANGAEVSRAMYPQYNALCAAQGYPWGDGDGATTFNLPNLIGKFAEGAENAGGYHSAALPNIEGSYALAVGNPTSGSIYKDNVITGYYRGSGSTGASDLCSVSFDASKSNSIYGLSDTVQPPSALLLPYVVVFTEATADSGLVDMTQVANELNRLDVHKFGDSDFTIIYPNGGTAESPANVTKNTRYVMDNPFSGYEVYCVAEIKLNGSWGEAGWYTDGSYAKGVKASALNDNIVAQTGNTQVLVTSLYSGNPFGYTGEVASAPCRIKIWKIGKAV